MRCTGHRCEKSVRKYKRSSEQIEMDVSKILDPPMNELACDTDPPRKKIKSENIPCENILQDQSRICQLQLQFQHWKLNKRNCMTWVFSSGFWFLPKSNIKV